MKRILYISCSPKLFGGAEHSLLDLLKRLDRNRFQPYFASNYDDQLSKEIKKLTIPFFKLNGFHKYGPLPFISSLLELRRFLRNEQIDLIHLNKISDAFYGLLPVALAKIPVVAHIRDTNLAKRDIFFTNFVRCNICISQWIQSKYCNAKNGVVIHNGIDIKQYTCGEKNEALVRQNQLGESDVVVGIVARISPDKGHSVFLSAAAKIRKQCVRVKFMIVGGVDSPRKETFRRTLKELVERLELSGDVIFTDHVSDVKEVMNLLDVVVVPSFEEPFGKVILEAMALEKPVVATNVGGPIDIVTDETGILIPPKDSTALADAVVGLIRDGEKRRRMGKMGGRRVKEYFTIEQTVDRIMNLYDRILQA